MIQLVVQGKVWHQGTSKTRLWLSCAAGWEAGLGLSVDTAGKIRAWRQKFSKTSKDVAKLRKKVRSVETGR